MTTNFKRCFASLERGVIIDVIDDSTGLTFHFGKSLDECRREYPDAEEMLVDDVCRRKAESQRTPITWEPSTESEFDEMLNVLPPERCERGAFLAGEPYDHYADTGEARFRMFRCHNKVYEVSSRPVSIKEFYSIIRG